MTSLILLVLLQPQDVGTPLTDALVQAAEQALGPGGSVVIRALPPGGMSDAAELDRARELNAFAVARVSWQPARGSSSWSSSPSSSTRRSSGAEPCCAEARVAVTIVATGRRAAQTLSFAPSDALSERARAVGLVLAALTEPERAARTAEAARARPPGGEATSTRAAAAAPEESDGKDTAAPAPPPAAPESRARPAPTAAPASAAGTGPLLWALDAVGEQGIALTGAGTGVGGAIGVRWAWLPRLALRAGVRGRFGDVGAAQASSRALAASLGAVVTLLPSGAVLATRTERSGGGGGHLGLAVRADALLLNESLSHLSADDPSPVRNGRWLPGAALFAEATWSMTSTAALLLNVGPEVAFGETRVIVHDAQVAALAPLRLVIQVGLLARF